jgi:hypothetical protein
MAARAVFPAADAAKAICGAPDRQGSEERVRNLPFVPAKAGTQGNLFRLDSRLRGNERIIAFSPSCVTLL